MSDVVQIETDAEQINVSVTETPEIVVQVSGSINVYNVIGGSDIITEYTISAIQQTIIIPVNIVNYKRLYVWLRDVKINLDGHIYINDYLATTSLINMRNVTGKIEINLSNGIITSLIGDHETEYGTTTETYIVAGRIPCENLTQIKITADGKWFIDGTIILEGVY